MKKQILAAALALTMALIGCAAPKAEDQETPAPTAEPALTAVPETAAEPSAEPAESAALEAQDAEGSAKAAYRAALTDVLEGRALPDGTDLSADAGADLAGTSFAVADVDGDGKSELVLLYGSAYTAGQTALIMGYGEAGLMHTELKEYPLLTFYEGGVIRADWSHNQGLAGSFWPYTLYRNDASSDTSRTIGMADAWDRSFVSDNFPDEIDVSKTGFVYYIMENGVYETVAPVDAAVYEAWKNGILGSAGEIALPLQQLSAENVAAIG